ncbi:DNA polymerase-3 subunit epsilon [Lutibacter agarilyticus]|uniref:DNA polymerase-3 subunit epsilon n=1 Tax=Lutibacter agarilyticus TaxID=1109740 RepID=A0A238Z2I1_9FLAO|nr:3'-5' exonuclease [Lutibacter agarilyticus]SNR77550.1 DNA polymerase-3 subunit epsilon [Lutibacter agarilyticus]
MFNWFKKNTHPEFWKNYLKKFKTKQPKTIEATRFVVFDTETTGLNTTTDRILSIGSISIFENEIHISDTFERYLIQQAFNAETVEIHGILKGGNIEKISEEKAIEQFINYVGNSVLVAHHAAFDIEMINIALKRMSLPKLKNKSIDTGILYKKLDGKKDNHFNLDVLCKEFLIPMHDRHTASGDAYITALLFLKIISKLKIQRTVHFSDLFRTSSNKGLM